MDFGIFDHLDRSALSLKDFYQARLKLIETYDEAGFYAYHVAEHHATPLGMAPSPSVFLAAVAQRTRRLRFGPLVYALPLHHPLRLIEEICMVDHLSDGRFNIGFGRGSSPMEIMLYGQNPAKAERIYGESLEIILQGLISGRVDFQGEFFTFKDYVLEVQPLQKPHPPIWYGVHSIGSAERAARRKLNVVSLDSAQDTRGFTDRFRQVWRETAGEGCDMPKMGIGRFIVVAETDAEALAAARRAYPVWHRSFYHLYKLLGGAPAHPRPADFDGVIRTGQGIAGNPETVTAFLQNQLDVSGATYVVGQFAFGDLSLDECLRSLDLFTRHIMPKLNPGGNKR
jgi:alkanesulfonate monooxygenase SsuD/methylene tetrahydromethanopterin reductase-like flavin-dependent oxidoreductase (luciferase family)